MVSLDYYKNNKVQKLSHYNLRKRSKPVFILDFQKKEFKLFMHQNSALLTYARRRYIAQQPQLGNCGTSPFLPTEATKDFPLLLRLSVRPSSFPIHQRTPAAAWETDQATVVGERTGCAEPVTMGTVSPFSKSHSFPQERGNSTK